MPDYPNTNLPPVDEKGAIMQVTEAIRELNKSIQLIHTELVDLKRTINTGISRIPR
jgi:hypothetical protein